MTDLKFTRILQENLGREIGKKCYVYGRRLLGKDVVVFMEPINQVLIFQENLSVFKCKYTLQEVKYPTAKIVGTDEDILLLDTNGNLYQCCNLPVKQSFFSDPTREVNKVCKWKQLDLSFKKVLAITEYQEGFACLGITESAKQFMFFKVSTLPNFEDYTFSELNASESHDYYLKAVKRPFNCMSLVVSDKVNGRTYLCSDIGQSSVIHYSRIPLISAISIVSENCLLLCFENGKLFFHFFSQVCSDNVLFLNSRVLCIEKCFCNDRCLLWSDGGNLHHTEISFSEGKLSMTNFKIENNIMGVIFFIKIQNHIIAGSINNMFYEISPDLSKRKEIVQDPGKILSQIYNESLKINHFQKELETAVQYINFKEMIQNNKMCMKLNCEGDFLIIKNMSGMTIKKEFWVVELRVMSDEECVQVKVFELETDMVIGMVIKIKNPFDKSSRFTVYLTGQFEMEILSFCIGIVWEQASSENKTLRQMLNKNNTLKRA